MLNTNGLIGTIFVAVAIAAVAAFRWTPAPAVQAEIRLAVSRTPLSTPVLVAAKLGFFAEAGLNARLTQCIGVHRCLEAVLAGEADLGTVSDSPITFAGFERDDFALVATFVSANHDVTIVTRDALGIAAAAGLAGKRVGAIKGTASEYFLHTYLIFGGVDPARVEVVDLQPEAMVDALIAGRVDAISVWEPFGFEAMKKLAADGRILPHPGVYTETFNLVATDRLVASRPEVLPRVLQALKRAIDFMRRDKQAAQQIVMDTLGQDREFIDWIWPHFNFDLTLGQAVIDTLESEARWALETELRAARPVPHYLEFIHERPLREVSPLAVTIIR